MFGLIPHLWPCGEEDLYYGAKIWIFCCLVGGGVGFDIRECQIPKWRGKRRVLLSYGYGTVEASCYVLFSRHNDIPHQGHVL